MGIDAYGVWNFVEPWPDESVDFVVPPELARVSRLADREFIAHVAFLEERFGHIERRLGISSPDEKRGTPAKFTQQKTATPRYG